MRNSKKTQDMIMLRSAGLSLASADRLAGVRRGSPVKRIAGAGVAILTLAGASVFAMNMPALTDTLAVEVPERPAPAPVIALPEPEPPEVPQQVIAEVQPVPVIAPVVEEVDCVADLAAHLSTFVLNFDAGSADIRTEDYDALTAIGQQASACPAARVLVAGHSDSSGSDLLNMQLSWQRAERTTEVLTSLGFDVSQFEVVGFGARAPLTEGDSAEDEINRRVELRIIKEGGQL